jgi:sarcosine oxidase
MKGDRASAVVVGAGVFGAAIADALAGRGWDVTLVEQVAPAQARGASGDVSRILRCAHGDDFDDAWLTRSARRARAGWIRLEEESGQQLLVRSGAAWLDDGGDPWLARAEQFLHDEGITAERLDPEAAAGLFPSLGTEGLASVLYEPEGGTLLARAAVRALAERAQRRGARLVLDHAIPRDGRAVLSDGVVAGADWTVWACGPWLGGLFGPAAPVQATAQDLFWWGVPPGWEAERVPAWVDMTARAYGMGDVDGCGLKAVVESVGEPLDPEAGERRSSPQAEAETRAVLARRFPALADAPVVARRVMPYESTPDERFLLGPHPGLPGVWLAGGGSGQGFKHGPAIGAYVADRLEGAAAPEARFAAGPRTGGPSGGAFGLPPQ